MSDVPDGCKMTEVGVIPEDWEVKTLGDIFTFDGGYSASRDQLSSDGHCYLHYGDIHKSTKSFIDVRVEYPNIPKLNILLKRISSKSLLHNGDVVFVDASEDDEGTSKHIVVVNNEDITYISGLHTIVAKSKVELLDNRYKRYCFQSRDIKRQFYFYAVGTKVSGISKTNIAKLQLPIPPFPEQQAIASALSDVDALITALEQLITKKRNIKQGAMQQLLTNEKRLPGFGGEWEVKAIGKEIDLLTGFPFPSSQYSSIGIKLLRGSNIKRGVTDWSDDITEFWEEITPDLKNYTLNKGDIVIAMDGSLVGRSFAILSKKDLPALLLQRVARIRSNKIDVGYLKEFICSDYFSKYCDSVKTVTAIPHISPEDIRNFTILLPPSKEEQQAIAQILADMDTEIESLEQKQAKYKAIKQGMMQELLTGKTRLV